MNMTLTGWIERSAVLYPTSTRTRDRAIRSAVSEQVPGDVMYECDHGILLVHAKSRRVHHADTVGIPFTHGKNGSYISYGEPLKYAEPLSPSTGSFLFFDHATPVVVPFDALKYAPEYLEAILHGFDTRQVSSLSTDDEHNLHTVEFEQFDARDRLGKVADSEERQRVLRTLSTKPQRSRTTLGERFLRVVLGVAAFG